jgi:hypothetical protein
VEGWSERAFHHPDQRQLRVPGGEMLNQNDRRRLEAIEHQLQDSDPDLARLLTHWPKPAHARWVMAAALGIAVVGTLGLVLGIMALAPVLVIWSAIMTVGGWTWVFRRARRA